MTESLHYWISISHLNKSYLCGTILFNYNQV